MFNLSRRGFRLIGRQRQRKLGSTIATLAIFGVIFLFLASLATFAWYSRDLPNPEKIRRKEGFSTIIYDRNGETLYDIFQDQNRIAVKLEDLPSDLKNAAIAVEDKNFYKHQGYSTTGILRSLFQIVIFHNLQGGSTLTQQLVKNVLLTAERTIPRKIKEFILAVQIERKYSKDEILQMYLNEAPFGGTIWGVETAAQSYFGKTTKELSLVECAFLAGLPQQPSVYSPYTGDPEAYKWRTEQVLRRMREDGYINKEQEEQAKSALGNLQFQDKGSNFRAPHFVMYIRKQLIDQFGEEAVLQGGFKVTTTLDYELQKAAEKIVAEEIEKLKGLSVGNGAVVVLDPNTGEILSMVGSKDYHAEDFPGQFNVAVQGLRQPGSAIKPFTYAAALEKGYTAASLLMDVETEFPGGTGQKDYAPKNYDGKFRGPVQLRFGLGNSINMIAVKTLALGGVKDTLALAYNMGLTTLEPTRENINRFGLSITLGGGEVTLLDLTAAFAGFATGGIRHEPVSILKIEDKNGKTVFENKKTQGKRVLEDGIAFIISHILADNNARGEVFGPNSWLNIAGNTVAVKTGTTDDKRDNWTVGYTREAVVGVWVGNNDNTPMNPKLASGVTGAAPIWNQVMRQVLAKRKDGLPDKPDSVVAMQIDSLGGGLPREGQPVRSEYFIKGTEPTSQSPIYQRLKISKNQTDRLANDAEIREGQYEERDFIVFAEDDPLSTDGRNRWQEGIDKWLAENRKDPLYHPPRDKSTQEVNKKPDPTNTPAPTAAVTPTPTVTTTPTATPTP